MAEVSAFLRMMDEVYAVFGLQYKMALSTRPEGYLGALALWNRAEAALEEALNASGKDWEVRAASQPAVLQYSAVQCRLAPAGSNASLLALSSGKGAARSQATLTPNILGLSLCTPN